MDGLNLLGRTRDIEIIGLGQSTLDDVVQTVAAEQGRVVQARCRTGKGLLLSLRPLQFCQAGSACARPRGVDYIGKPEGWGLQMREKYTTEDYHKPSDKIKPYWDLSGTVEDLRLLGEVGYRVANGKAFPAWKAGSEFKAKRQETEVRRE